MDILGPLCEGAPAERVGERVLPCEKRFGLR